MRRVILTETIHGSLSRKVVSCCPCIEALRRELPQSTVPGMERSISLLPESSDLQCVFCENADYEDIDPAVVAFEAARR